MIKKSIYFVVVAATMMLGFSTIGSAQTSLPISINNSSGAALTDFTARVELNAANAPGFDFAGDGSDIIVFTDDRLSLLDFYVESIDDVTDTAVIWVRVPTVPVSPPDTTFLLDYNRTDIGDVTPGTPPLSSAENTFVTPGFRWHSQFDNSPAPGPESRAAGEAIFNFDVVEPLASGRSCITLNELGIDNSNAITNAGGVGANMDYGLFIETILLVQTPGDYEFRFGTDFGNGGELYLDDITLEEGWDEDLWWALDYSNPDVLQGTLNLSAGPHTLRALGFEGCCDGPTSLQYRRDFDGDGNLGDEAFVDLDGNTTDLLARATSCPAATVIIGPPQTVPVTLATFESRKIGPFIRLNWETADESFNLGFDVWTLETDEDGEESLRPLRDRLIRSKTFDTSSPTQYRLRIRDTEGVENIVLSSMDTNGAQEFFGPFEIGERYGADIEPQPIDWQSVHADFVANMRAQGYIFAHNRWRKQRRIDVRPSTGAQVAVKEDGVYRITYEELAAQGLDWRGVNHRRISVTHDGQAIPRRVSARRFGPGEYIDFVGLAPRGEMALYQDERRYQLEFSRTLARNAVDSRRAASNPAPWVYKSRTLRDITLYTVGSPSDTPWMMARLFRLSNNPVSRSFTMTLPEDENIPENTLARLKLELNSVVNIPLQDIDGDGSLDNNHRFAIQVNGQQVLENEFGGQRTFPQQIDFSTALLQAGANEITLVLLDSGYRVDTMSVESITLEYPSRTLSSAANGELVDAEFDGVTVPDSFSGIAYQFDEQHNLLALAIDEQGSLPLSSVAGSRLFLASQPLTVERIELRQPSTTPEVVDSDLMVISHPNFLGETLESYLEQRRLQGISSQVIDTNAIQNHYGADVSLSVAIQRFIRDAAQKVEFDSILLIGGHSYDYRGFLTDNNLSFIPSFYRRIGFANFTPSDLPLADIDDDGYPDKAIGRWPVRTSAELAVITEKSLLWVERQQTRQTQGHDLLMMADRREELDFSADSDTQLAILQTQDLTFNSVSRLYIDDLVADPTIDRSRLNEEIETRGFAALNASPSWVYYNGHASPTTWTSNGLLNSARVADLENNGFMVTSVGCFTTYFEDPSNNTLAHQLLFADLNGAVAIHGPAVVGDYFHQRRLAELISKNSDQADQIGDAITQGMLRLPINYSAILPNWTLLGDPTLPLQ